MLPPPSAVSSGSASPGQVHGGEEVDGQRGGPVLRRDRREAAGARPDRADVVHQDVQFAERLYRCFDDRCRPVR